MPVIEVTGWYEDMAPIITTHNVAIVEVYSENIPDCQAMRPVFEELSNSPDFCPDPEHTMSFLRVNWDKHKDINIGVRKLPHYAFYLNGGECDQVKGNKPDEVRSEVRRFYNFFD